jgi:hypothetical protein
MHFAWMGDDSRGHFARVRSHDRVRRDPRHSRSETARALEGKLRRSSAAVATSREGHRLPSAIYELHGPALVGQHQVANLLA